MLCTEDSKLEVYHSDHSEMSRDAYIIFLKSFFKHQNAQTHTFRNAWCLLRMYKTYSVHNVELFSSDINVIDPTLHTENSKRRTFGCVIICYMIAYAKY